MTSTGPGIDRLLTDLDDHTLSTGHRILRAIDGTGMYPSLMAVEEERTRRGIRKSVIPGGKRAGQA